MRTLAAVDPPLPDVEHEHVPDASLWLRLAQVRVVATTNALAESRVGALDASASRSM